MFWHVLGTHINPGCLLRGPMAEHIFGHDMPTFGRIRCACFHRNPLLPSKCGGVSRLPLENDEATVFSIYPQVGDLEICLLDRNLANNLLIYVSVFAIYVLHNVPNILLLHHEKFHPHLVISCLKTNIRLVLWATLPMKQSLVPCCAAVMDRSSKIMDSYNKPSYTKQEFYHQQALLES